MWIVESTALREHRHFAPFCLLRCPTTTYRCLPTPAWRGMRCSRPARGRAWNGLIAVAHASRPTYVSVIFLWLPSRLRTLHARRRAAPRAPLHTPATLPRYLLLPALPRTFLCPHFTHLPLPHTLQNAHPCYHRTPAIIFSSTASLIAPLHSPLYLHSPYYGALLPPTCLLHGTRAWHSPAPRRTLFLFAASPFSRIRIGDNVWRCLWPLSPSAKDYTVRHSTSLA